LDKENNNMNPTLFPRARRALLLGACALACVAPVRYAGAFNWSADDQVQGSGHLSTQSRQVGHFDGVALGLPATLELHIGNNEGVTVEADDNLQPLIETVVEDGTLKIRAQKRGMHLRAHTLKIVVTARGIERVALGGTGSIVAAPLHSPKLRFDIGGSGSIKVANVQTDALAATIGGSGELKVDGGAARQVSITIAGSGDVDLGRVKADGASVKMAGSGGATVWAAKTLTVTVAGSGDVNYYGDPAVSQSMLGSGQVRRLGAAPH
jgi:hypothetical protein